MRAQSRAMFDADGRAERLVGSIIDVSDLHAAPERLRDLSQLASDWFWERYARFRFTHFSENADRREGPGGRDSPRGNSGTGQPGQAGIPRQHVP